VIAAVLLTVLAATPDDCRSAYDALRFREAIETCKAAIPGAPPEQLTGLYRFLGLSLATVGDDPVAFQAFVSLLALDPTEKLSETLSPKLAAPFQAARSAGAASPVHLSIEPARPPRADRRLSLKVSVTDSLLRPVVRLHAVLGSLDASASRVEGPVLMALGVPGVAGTASVEVEGIDRFGGRIGIEKLALQIPPPPPPRPTALSWKVWLATTAGLALLSAGSGVYSQWIGRQGNAQTFADRAALDATRSKWSAYGADVGFALSLAFGVGAVLLLATLPRDDE
jgi:hypothetical protein